MRTFYSMLRIPNLLIIALTFFILRYLVFIPIYTLYALRPSVGAIEFSILVAITLLIASTGYIINDYFDVRADEINKPYTIYIKSRSDATSALSTAIILSMLAFILIIFLSLKLNNWPAFILLCVALVIVWWYAISLKRSFLWGNLAVACMTAGTIVMTWLIEKWFSPLPAKPKEIVSIIITALGIFAFLLTLLREIVKDMEDLEGDKVIKCRSLPIVKGLSFTREVIIALTIFTFVLLFCSQVYLFRFNRIVAIAWLFSMVEIPLFYFLTKLKSTNTKSDFHTQSMTLKWIMVGGIGSIVAGQF